MLIRGQIKPLHTSAVVSSPSVICARSFRLRGWTCRKPKSEITKKGISCYNDVNDRQLNWITFLHRKPVITITCVSISARPTFPGQVHKESSKESDILPVQPSIARDRRYHGNHIPLFHAAFMQIYPRDCHYAI